jgi:hypothetical protein
MFTQRHRVHHACAGIKKNVSRIHCEASFSLLVGSGRWSFNSVDDDIGQSERREQQ